MKFSFVFTAPGVDATFKPLPLGMSRGACGPWPAKRVCVKPAALALPYTVIVEACPMNSIVEPVRMFALVEVCAIERPLMFHVSAMFFSLRLGNHRAAT
jgi:hypothetical protein